MFVDFDLAVVVRSQVAGEAHGGLEVLGVDIAGGKIEGRVDHTRINALNSRFPSVSLLNAKGAQDQSDQKRCR